MIIAEPITAGKGPFPPIFEDNAIGPTGQELRNKVVDLEDSVRGVLSWGAADLLAKARSRLSELAQIGANWDSYGAPAPNTAALENAVRILGHMNFFDLISARIVPSAEGGIGFCFSEADRYADIESTNDGDIVGVRYAGVQAPALIETDGTDESIEAALQQVRNHISA